MAEKKTIAIVGATGTQGGGLATAILTDQHSRFTARVVTRDPDSPKAKELAQRGAEVVAADVDDPSSLQRAFEGAYGAYCVTFYWAHLSPEKELAEARSMANAAKQAGVEHVIWSTLEDTRKSVPLEDPGMPTLQGRYKVPHFDAKGEANQFFADLGVPTTFYHTSFYWDNLINFGMGPKRGGNGKLVFTLPMGDKKLAGIAGDDIGKCAYGIFNAGAEYIGMTVGVAGEHLTGNEMAAALSDALGEEVQYDAIAPAAYRGLGFPGAEDLANMFQFYQEFEDHFMRTRDVALARRLNPELQSFTQWLNKNKDHIPL